MGHTHISTTMIYAPHVPKHDAADTLTRLVAAGQTQEVESAAVRAPICQHLAEAVLGAWVVCDFRPIAACFGGQIRRGSPSEGLRMALRASPIENDYY